MSRLLIASSLAALMGTATGHAQTADIATPPALPVEEAAGTPPPLPVTAPEVARFFVEQDGVAVGPLTATELGKKIATGQVGPATLAWIDGMVGWEPSQAVPEIAALMPGADTDAGGAEDATSEEITADIAPGVEMPGDVAAQLVGEWTQRTLVPIDGLGLGQAQLSVTLTGDMQYTMDGDITVQVSGTATNIDVGGTGRYSISNIDANTFDLQMDGTLSMAIPAMNMSESSEPLIETTRYEFVDANTLRDTATGDILTRVQP